jgi:hypothetical protein
MAFVGIVPTSNFYIFNIVFDSLKGCISIDSPATGYETIVSECLFAQSTEVKVIFILTTGLISVSKSCGSKCSYNTIHSRDFGYYIQLLSSSRPVSYSLSSSFALANLASIDDYPEHFIGISVHICHENVTSANIIACSGPMYTATSFSTVQYCNYAQNNENAYIVYSASSSANSAVSFLNFIQNSNSYILLIFYSKAPVDVNVSDCIFLGNTGTQIFLIQSEADHFFVSRCFIDKEFAPPANVILGPSNLIKNGVKASPLAVGVFQTFDCFASAFHCETVGRRLRNHRVLLILFFCPFSFAASLASP